MCVSSVSHLKKEQSHETNPEGAFGFQWRLRLTFDENMITFDPTLNIVDFSFETTLPETKRIIMGAVFHLVDSNAMYRSDFPFLFLSFFFFFFFFLTKF